MTSSSARAELQSIILDQIEETDELIRKLEEATKPVGPDDSMGRLSRMEALNAKSINEEALRMAREKISNLDQARQRLNDENFGICARCGKPIDLERLLIMPESRICVPCKSAKGP